MTTKTKFSTSNFITAEPMMNNIMTTEAYTSSNLSDSNSFNDGGNSNPDDQQIKENNGNNNDLLNNNDNCNNFTIYEIEGSREELKLINHTNQDISPSIPLEFNLNDKIGIYTHIYIYNFIIE